MLPERAPLIVIPNPHRGMQAQLRPQAHPDTLFGAAVDEKIIDPGAANPLP
jgi:hypothetical protein